MLSEVQKLRGKQCVSSKTDDRILGGILFRK